MQFSHVDFHAVEHEDTAFSGLSDLVGVQQLELSGALVMVVLDTDTAVPLLDLARLCPKSDIHWFRAVENQSCGCDMD